MEYVDNPATYLGYPKTHNIQEVFYAILIVDEVFSILGVCPTLDFVVLDSSIVFEATLALYFLDKHLPFTNSQGISNFFRN
jgi:hypothetical protein